MSDTIHTAAQSPWQELTDSIIARFWSKVAIADACWEWQAKKDMRNYGVFYPWTASAMKAHRFSYQLHFGKLPPTVLVCHRCDNPLCVRPDHLFAGTQKDNMADCVSKGRHKHVAHYGESNGQNKLSKEAVILIRRSHRHGLASKRALSRAFGVSQKLILNIIARKAWAHLPPEEGEGQL